MSNTIIFLSIIILFLSLMLMFKINIFFDMSQNKMVVILHLFQFKLITIRISIIGLYYQINNSKKLKTLNIFLIKEQKYLLEQIKSSIIDKLYYDDIVFRSSIGLGNASNTALSVGLLNFICNLLKDYLYTKNHDTCLFYNNVADFENTNINFSLELKVYFTIFDLFFAIIMSFYKRGKYVKERKK